MKWISRILGGGEQHPSDPIIAECQEIALKHGLSLNEEEWTHVLHNRDRLAASQLGGKFVHKDVVHVLCFLCLFEGVFQTGVELVRMSAHRLAIDELEKARKLLPWPTVLYTLGLAHAGLGNRDVATRFYRAALECFEARSTYLLTIVPASVPDRESFLRTAVEMFDTGSLALGFTGMAELRDALDREAR